MTERRGLARRGLALLVALGMTFALAGPTAADTEAVTTAGEQILTSAYEDALATLDSLQDDAADGRVAKLRVEALSALGRLDEALEIARDRIGLEERAGALLWRKGELEQARAKLEEGWRRGDLPSTVQLGLLLRQTGEPESATALFYQLIDAYNQRSRLSYDELVAVGLACKALGTEDPNLFKDALKAFDEAVDLEPSRLEARIETGKLFLEKYDSTEAQTALGAVLNVSHRHPEALLAMARVLRFDGNPQAGQLLDAALATNPRFVDALLFKAEILLGSEQARAAREITEEALQINPRSLEALSVAAAAAFLSDQDAEFEELESRVLAINPRYAELYNRLSEASVQNRLYVQARDFARRAVDLEPRSWRGLGLLGMNELRLGEMEAGKEHLEASFRGDPYNVWNKNTLDLVDTFDDYVTTRSERFEVVAHKDEAAVIAPYVHRLAEEAYEALVSRYEFEPPTPIRLEVFPSHADFSVRTVGLAGLGALGVCFGPVIALDSPTARPRGHFNWGSTLWHEITHTFTLLMTKNRIPRWLTEGLSVLEERRGRQGWGDDIEVQFLTAYAREELLPLAQITDGFVRPKSAQQVALSYHQSSLIAELIEAEWGFGAVRQILLGYADGKSTEEVFESALQIALEELDERFFAHLDERYAIQIAALGHLAPERETQDGVLVQGIEESEEEIPGVEEEAPDAIRFGNEGRPSLEDLLTLAEERPDEFRIQLALGAALVEEGRREEGTRALEKAIELFPEYVGPGNAYLQLAGLAAEQEDDAAQTQWLSRFTQINETHYDAHKELAALFEAGSDREREADLLERMIYIDPFDGDVHARLAQLHTDAGRHTDAVGEYQALVALEPPDLVDALLELAYSQRRAAQPREAKRSLLRALEIAPSYEPAQDLLLELTTGGAR